MDKPSLLDGKTALITGGTAGIGFHTASALAGLGAEVFITGRDASRGQEAERVLRLTSGTVNVHFIKADASSVGGNQELAKRVLGETDRLHILLNNVGGLYNDRWETDDCYEATLAMNLVGPFALTQALLPALRKGTPARIVNVASQAYTMWNGDPFEDIQAEQLYNGTQAYARSKLLNILWTFALARGLEGSGIVANAIHPGTAWTAQTQGSERRILPAGMRLFWPVFRLIQRSGSAEKAARTSVYLASAPEAASITGNYFESSTRPKNPGPAVLDQAKQEKTWELAEALVCAAPTAIPESAVEKSIATG